MSFDLFGNTRREDIRVGYISTDRGFVSDVSVYEANKFAELNPGAQFVVNNRDKTAYLSINNLNEKSISDINFFDPEEGSCGGPDFNIQREDSNGLYGDNFRNVTIEFLGGGGVGAQANPVIGKDGTLMAVDLIHGGFGYQYPPVVQVSDPTGIGAGARATAFLGQSAEQLEYFTDEDEFEDLDFSLAPNFLIDRWGVRRDLDGFEIGDWKPIDYANLTTDPIRSEIVKYQEFVKRKTIGDAWWDSRSFIPSEVTVPGKTTRIAYPVTHPFWGGKTIPAEKNDGMIQAFFTVYSQGSVKNREIKFTFEAEDGSHKFEVQGINKKNESDKQVVRVRKVKINTTYIVTSNNNRKKVKNSDRAIEQGFVRNENGRALETQSSSPYAGVGQVIFADVVDSANDNDDLQLYCDRGRFKASNKKKVKEYSKKKQKIRKRSTYDLTFRINFGNPIKTPATSKIKDTFMNTYAVSPIPPLSILGSDFGGQTFTMSWSEYFPYTGEYKFKGIADNFATLTVSGGPTGTQVFESELARLNGTEDTKEGATPKDITKTIQEGLYNIRIDISNKPEYDRLVTKTGGDAIFDTMSSKDKADRKLWRMNPTITSNSKSKDANFLNKYGVCPFDPGEAQEETVPSSLKFDREGDKLYVVAEGAGQIRGFFQLDIDDDPTTSGLAVTEVSIETDDDLLRIRRGQHGDEGKFDLTDERFRENDKKSGSGIFTAGKKYRVKVLGGAKGSGIFDFNGDSFKIDDNIGNGSDKNAEFEITSFKSVGNTNTVQSSNDYAGEHLVRWENVKFPESGNYVVKVQADDSARILIGNIGSGGEAGDGSGLRGVKKGGEEEIFNASKSSLKESTRFFKKGQYRIRVELTQLPGKALNKGNPMGIAIKIMTPKQKESEKVLSDTSWMENPTGVALTIDAPQAPKPQEIPPPQRGRCPNNPLWTTRFTKGDNAERWFPCYDRRWSPFMNRYAISPIKPKASEGSALSGNTWSKTWRVDIPYDGFYGVKGTSDNVGSISVGGQQFKLNGFNNTEPDLNKVFLRRGNANVTVQVNNETTDYFKKVPRVIFDTADWAVDPIVLSPDRVKKEIICRAGGGYGGNRDGSQTKVGRVKVGKGNDGAPGEGDETRDGANGGGAGLRKGKAQSGKGGTIDGGFGSDEYGEQRGNNDEVRSDGDSGGKGALYGGGGGGSRNRFKAGDGADGAVFIIWGSTGKSVLYAEPGVYEVLVPETAPGRNLRTSVRMKCIGGGGSGYTETSVDEKEEVKIGEGRYDGDTIDIYTDREVISGGGGSGGAYAYNTLKLPANARLQVVVGEGGKAYNTRGSSNGFDSYVKVLKADYDPKYREGRQIKKNGVKYTGPNLATYTKKGPLAPYISPFLVSGRYATEEVQGKQWDFAWDGIEFEYDGNYEFDVVADDAVRILIDGVKVYKTNTVGRLETFTKEIKSGKKQLVVELINSNQPGTNYNLNPVYVGLKVKALDKVETEDPRSWRENPVGTSAMLIPPPCPKEIGGIGIITSIVPSNPGTGYTVPTGPGYPGIVELIDVVVVEPGINYIPTDPVVFIAPPVIPGPPGPPLNVPNIPGPRDPNDPGDTSQPDFRQPIIDVPITVLPDVPGTPQSGTGNPGAPGAPPIPPPGVIGEIGGPPGSPGDIVGLPGDGGEGAGGPGGGTGGGRDPVTGDPIIAVTPPGGPDGFSFTGPGPASGAAPEGQIVGPGGAIIAPGGQVIDPGGVGSGPATEVVLPGGAVPIGSGGVITTPPPAGTIPGSGAAIVDNSDSLGAVVQLVTGPFGRIIAVNVLAPGRGFTSTPTIKVLSNTGVNAVLRPIFRLVRDPLGVDPSRLIQVTDLVGLKQTGYINGRAYYGQVFFKNGFKYAGVYETAGELVQVYNTLAESISGQVTTPASAIPRQGTDVRDNLSQLNIPNTPQDLQ